MKKAFTLIEILVVIVIAGIFLSIVVPAFYTTTYNNRTETLNDPDYHLYRAWLKANGQYFPTFATISFSEWKDLRKNNLLPVNVQTAR